MESHGRALRGALAPDWQAKQNASFPVGRVGRAEEVAAACAFLLSAECPMMTGTTITIDGGLGA